MKHAIYARIDERLIHGQVSLRWKQAYDVTRYIVVDDSSAQDIFRQKLLTANDDTPTDFVTVDQAVQIIPEYKEDVLLRFFTEVLGVDKEVALKDACRMEHTISDETLAKLIFFIGKVDKEDSFKKTIKKKMKE